MGFRNFGIFWHPNFQILASSLQKNLATPPNMFTQTKAHSAPFSLSFCPKILSKKTRHTRVNFLTKTKWVTT